jgi:2'-5' RNA ligase
MQRLFVGIALPNLITQHLSMLTGGVPGARWQRPDQIHLTLRFIGDVDGAAAEDARAVLSKTKTAQFDLQLEGVGYFGEGRRVRALWFVVTQNAALVVLKGKVERALVEAGFAPDSRKFKPHVTVARMGHANHERVAKFLASHALFRSDVWRVDAFHLYSSQLSPKGSLYKIEDSYDLSL